MMKRWAQFLLPSISEMVFLSVFLLLTLQHGQALLRDGDTGYHIRTGEFIIQNWTIPEQDIFSFRNPPVPWVAHEWLSEIIMAIVHRVSGLTGVVIFFSFIIATTYFLLFRMLRQESRDVLLGAVIACFAAISSTPHWLARPHIFSLALTVIWYHLLNGFQYRQKNRLFLLPLLTLLWVNLHGGYIVGILLVGIYVVGNLVSWITHRETNAEHFLQNSKSLLVIMIVCVLVSMINPQGYRILLFPFKVTSDRFLMDHVQEFLSPNFHEPLPFKYLLLLLIAVIARSRPTVNWIELILILAFTYMALFSVRYITLFAIIIGPILIRLLDQMKQELPAKVSRFFEERSVGLSQIDRQTSGYFWSMAGLIAIVSLGVAGSYHYEFSQESYPVAAVEFLKKENVVGNTFTHDDFGDYLIYAAWPQHKVFIDGRTDMYGAERMKEYLTLAHAMPGWKEITDKYAFSSILFDTHSPLVNALAEDRNWQLIYSDPLASIFLRKDGRNQRLIDKYPHVTLTVAENETSNSDPR
jgi:hypothetical protein